MKAELQEELFGIEPGWFDRKDSQASLMCFGFSVGDGWYDIIKTILSMAKSEQKHWDQNVKYAKKWESEGTLIPEYKKYLDPEAKNPFAPGNFSVQQVKEKFGTLRFYYDGGDEAFGGAVTMAESLTHRVCEECGNRGELRQGGWLRTLCDPCAEASKKPRRA